MRAALIAALVLLGACAAPDRAAPVIAPGGAPLARGAAAQELMAYLGRLRGMGESALATEATRQRQAAARDASELARLKAAIALALAQPNEEAEVLALVEPIAKGESGDADMRAMASFLHILAVDRRRLKESAATAGARLREERRAVEAQKQRAEAAQERAAQLQQKLDALTELEKSLSDRQLQSR